MLSHYCGPCGYGKVVLVSRAPPVGASSVPAWLSSLRAGAREQVHLCAMLSLSGSWVLTSSSSSISLLLLPLVLSACSSRCVSRCRTAAGPSSPLPPLGRHGHHCCPLALLARPPLSRLPRVPERTCGAALSARPRYDHIQTKFRLCLDKHVRQFLDSF